MTKPLQLKARGIQILTLLKEYGPISFRGLKYMLKPEIKEKRLHESLGNLYKNGLISKRHERLFRGMGIFYQINQDDFSRKRIASALSCIPKELHQPYFISRELLHSEACGLWAHKLKLMYPDAIVIRDFRLPNEELVQNYLFTSYNDYDLLPDLMMIIKGKPTIAIAFEVERSRKSKKRLLQKLNKYANETAIDGLVYLCDSTEVSEPIRRTFAGSVYQKSLRIKHYRDYFFLFSNAIQPPKEQGSSLVNANFKTVSLNRWVDYLKATPTVARRNEDFEVAGVSSCHLVGHN